MSVTQEIPMKRTESIASIKVSIPSKTEFIKNADDVYFASIRNWDREKLYSKKEYKILALNDEGRVICEILYTPEDRKYSSVKALVKVAKDKKASKIAISENSPNKDLYPNDRENAIARIFKQYSDELELPVVNQIILTNGGYYLFPANP